ncbi:peptidoglycan/xylan/chitin deacetylase (PgdA/CDA1 family) [Kribbella amoyensis]|uniref:Peptidoglycan/xylan/chitin deacetylase (PgdA/CDA1 family) n=1 Tax=Kribbella amoyensis TaxID=996641 RepID=A0A561BWI8_9ACTN|nr:polysaccharide deacetylase family protein [Kribbella amoyensis]TWD83239.1 peptidoglycan/xylan/chitin deacetylase (PgdA/CDA1 family) [Kribbella amoyensis]
MTLFNYSPITERPPIAWPDGKRVAFYVGLNLEHFLPGEPSTSIWPLDVTPDPLNHGWRDYGARVGIWRTIDILDRYGIRASALVNSMVVEHNPQIIRAGVERDWAWLAHGQTNSILHTGYLPDDERPILTEITTAIESATGRRPRGWMGPALTETVNTPALLREHGYQYVLDWTNDDQPYHLNVPGMISVPYTVELNDLGLFLRGLSGPDFLQMVKDQFDVLRDESAASGRVMALALHPFVIGQAFRAKYLDLALEYIAARPDVWLTTSDEIATHYLTS